MYYPAPQENVKDVIHNRNSQATITRPALGPAKIILSGYIYLFINLND